MYVFFCAFQCYLSGPCQLLNSSKITHVQWLIYTPRKYFLGVQIFFSRWTPVRCLYAVLLCWRGSRRHCTLGMFRAGSQVVDHQISVLTCRGPEVFFEKMRLFCSFWKNFIQCNICVLFTSKLDFYNLGAKQPPNWHQNLTNFPRRSITCFPIVH